MIDLKYEEKMEAVENAGIIIKGDIDKIIGDLTRLQKSKEADEDQYDALEKIKADIKQTQKLMTYKIFTKKDLFNYLTCSKLI